MAKKTENILWLLIESIEKIELLWKSLTFGRFCSILLDFQNKVGIVLFTSYLYFITTGRPDDDSYVWSCQTLSECKTFQMQTTDFRFPRNVYAFYVIFQKMALATRRQINLIEMLDFLRNKSFPDRFKSFNNLNNTFFVAF